MDGAVKRAGKLGLVLVPGIPCRHVSQFSVLRMES